MGGSARTRLVALVALVAIALPVAIVLASGGEGGGKKERQRRASGLRVERSDLLPEVVVYVKRSVNKPAQAHGRRQVRLTCVDADGRVLARQDEAWPFGQTDGGVYEPHTHMSLDGDLLAQVRPLPTGRHGPAAGGPAALDGPRRRGDRPVGLRGVGRAEDRRAGHEQGRARLGHPARVGGVDAAVDLDRDVGAEQLAQPRHLAVEVSM